MTQSIVYTGFATNEAQIGKIAAKYQLTADKIKDMEPVLHDIGDTIQEIIKRNFESQGRRKGGSWPALKKDTIRRKLDLVGASHGVRLQRGGFPFGGGFFVRGRGAGSPSGVLKPNQGAIHVYEMVRLTDRLYNAAIGRTGESVREIHPYAVVIGVKGIDYAAVQRYGGGNKIPARDYMMVDEADRIQMLRLVEAYIFVHYGSGGVSGAKRPKGLGGYVFG